MSEHKKLTKHKKFLDGKHARSVWSTPLQKKDVPLSISDYNSECGVSFVKMASITLDASKRQTTIRATPYDGAEDAWKKSQEVVYALVADNRVVKIGGTRAGMKDRWNSYLCGHCVSERYKKDCSKYPGKMSGTNATIYHTIENSLLRGKGKAKWDIWCWVIPPLVATRTILGDDVDVVVQMYHAYESRCIKKYKDITNVIPILCKNSDSKYRN